MAGGKQTPRQRMIGILYLVLLGLVALNVSDSILDAFRNLTTSLETSTQNVQSGVDATFSSFEATKLKEEPERARPIYDKAKLASKYARDLDGYLTELKKEFASQGGGINEKTGDLKKRDDLDISSRLMINQKKGAELKKRINETREKLLSLLDEKDRNGVNFSLQAVDPPARALVKKSWEDVNFGEGIPLTAAITALAKIQADVKNAESEMVKKLLGKMDVAVVNLDQFAAVAVAPTSYVIQGQPYTAEVFLTASDSKSSPDITVGGSRLQVKDGKGRYSVNTSREGVFSWVGTVRVRQTDGKVKTYTTGEQKYQVARPSAVVSPDKMNVFYIGVPNPVSVSAPGIPKESMRVSMSGGSISGSNGKYTVNVSSAGAATVNVSATINGKVMNIGSSNFRVKRIPDPIAKFAGKTGGPMSSVIIKSVGSIFATLENFDFDAKFSVTRFSMTIVKPRADAIGPITSNGNTMSGAMKSAIAGVTPGTRVFFDQIIAVGPDGSQRQLNSIALSAN
ncbi:MAG TPA: gliding motility protein GldM [Sphingobacteriaceae bacterium]|nr:gliding motility protein GldM [Sphingobacteriaceae bacterium]